MENNPQEVQKPPSELSASIDLAARLAASALLLVYGLGFVIVAGMLATIAANVSYWNWYGFPTSYTLAALVDMVVGYALAGLVMAWFIKKE